MILYPIINFSGVSVSGCKVSEVWGIGKTVWYFGVYFLYSSVNWVLSEKDESGFDECFCSNN